MDSIQIPDKTYFKIGEVAKLLDLQPYVLRYWETEFDALHPEKTKSGQRAYRRDDIELLVLIKVLLYDEMYTIAGARRQIKLRKRGEIEPLGPEAQQRLVQERDTLKDEREAWEKERARLASAAEAHQEEAARLRVQNETLEDENAQLAAAQLDYESSIKRLRDEVTARRTEVSNLEQRVEEMVDDSTAVADNRELEVVNAEYAEKIAVLEQSNASLAEALESAQASVASIAERAETAEAAVTAGDAAAQEWAAEKQRFADELAALEADLASAESELERLESDKLSLLAQVADSSQLDELQQQLDAAKVTIANLEEERGSLMQDRKATTERQAVHFGVLRQELQSLAALVH